MTWSHGADHRGVARHGTAAPYSQGVLDHLTATRYVTPLREGGSLPGLVEADDLGTYVLKFRGAGQGLKVLVAEVIVAGIADAIGVPVPRLAVIDLQPAIAKYEADEEVQDLLNASLGDNLGIDFLPGAFGYDGSQPAPANIAERIVWLDAFTANVDRTWSNPNLLVWHGNTWAIDHGAALYFHHSWPSREPNAARFASLPFDPSKHVLADLAPSLGRLVQPEAAAILTTDRLTEILNQVPEAWLETTPWLPDAEAVQAAYVEHLTQRLGRSDTWLDVAR